MAQKQTIAIIGGGAAGLMAAAYAAEICDTDTQEILLIACRSTNHFENEKAFYAFVWKTAGNILKGWYRKQAGQRTEEPDENMADRRYEELEEPRSG